MRANPYQTIEGLAIAAFCVDAPFAYFALKASFGVERAAVTRAVEGVDAASCPASSTSNRAGSAAPASSAAVTSRPPSSGSRRAVAPKPM